jgi:hypothetical protein
MHYIVILMISFMLMSCNNQVKSAPNKVDTGCDVACNNQIYIHCLKYDDVESSCEDFSCPDIYNIVKSSCIQYCEYQVNKSSDFSPLCMSKITSCEEMNDCQWNLSP